MPLKRKDCGDKDEASLESLEDTLKHIPQLLAKRITLLDKREKDLEDERQNFEREKKEMGLNYQASDVLHLNVGGDTTTLAVLRKIITSVKGSMLASRFSGRWDESLEKDRDGNVFIDQPIELFRPMVNYLRARANETPVTPPMTSPNTFGSDSSYTDFVRMVEYYGMTPGIYPTRVELHCGREEDSSISLTNVTAQEWSTLTLEPVGHSRPIKSFEVRLEELEGFHIGWLNKSSWAKDTSKPNVVGLAEHETKVALDLVRRKIRCGSQVSTLEVGFSVDRGTMVRCELSPAGNNWEVKWFIDGTEVGHDFGGFKCLIHGSFVPAFSGKGKWSISNVELMY